MNQPRSRIRLRLHHFMCVHGFKGKGYSPEYVENFWRIFNSINEAEVEAVIGADDICMPCPNNDDGTCRPKGVLDEPRIRKIDDAYSKTLGIKNGEVLSWDEVKEIIAEKVTDEDFEQNCEPCGWKRLGYCKEALKKIRTEKGRREK